LVGTAALDRELKKRLPYWWRPEHVQAQPVVDAAVRAMTQRMPMQRPTLADLDDLGDKVGLGGDRPHPRSFLHLGTHLKERFLDVLATWETTLQMPTAWSHKVIAIPKPDGGGSRTIGRSTPALRIWSKLRQPIAADWEHSAPDEAFW
jgi:hypothetical protein